MPQTNSAKKALKAAARKRVVNDRWRVKYRSAVKAVKDAASGKTDAKKINELYKAAQSMIDRATRRNILHKNTAARKKSVLQKAVSGNKKA